MEILDASEFYTLSLDQINNISDISLKKEMLTLYNEQIKILEQDSIGKLFIDPNISIEEIYYNIDQYTESLKSNYLFDNETVKFYPSIKECKAAKNITCHFSGGTIYKGSTYCSYRPFIQNIDSGKKYVLKDTIKVELYYRDELPTTLKEFEEFIYNLDTAYKLQKNNGTIDFYTVSCNLRSWTLQELKQKRKVLK